MSIFVRVSAADYFSQSARPDQRSLPTQPGSASATGVSSFQETLDRALYFAQRETEESLSRWRSEGSGTEESRSIQENDSRTDARSVENESSRNREAEHTRQDQSSRAGEPSRDAQRETGAPDQQNREQDTQSDAYVAAHTPQDTKDAKVDATKLARGKSDNGKSGDSGELAGEAEKLAALARASGGAKVGTQLEAGARGAAKSGAMKTGDGEKSASGRTLKSEVRAGEMATANPGKDAKETSAAVSGSKAETRRNTGEPKNGISPSGAQTVTLKGEAAGAAAGTTGHDGDAHHGSSGEHGGRERAGHRTITVQVSDARNHHQVQPDGGQRGEAAKDANSAHTDFGKLLASNTPDGSDAARGVIRGNQPPLQNSPLQSALFRQLRDQVNSDIVRQAKFTIKDNSGGEIKLILKPEHLGRVRFQLHLQDNHIGGRIIVENSSVRHVFEQNLENLQRAFKESGMQMDQVQVSVEQGDSGQKESQQKRPLRSVQAVGELERSVPRLREFEMDTNLINVLA